MNLNIHQRDRHCLDVCLAGIGCVANSSGTSALTRHFLHASSSRFWCSWNVRRPFCSSLSSISSNLESCILIKGISIICSQAAYVADLSILLSLSSGLTRATLSHEPKKEINAGIFNCIKLRRYQLLMPQMYNKIRPSKMGTFPQWGYAELEAKYFQYRNCWLGPFG